ncbi:hypothetical protein [Pseudophaeobacter leonis]|uniref:hypothetical protein n=1 Tax=Pseudophaeobacter leonis TaxID=1144477 RepID=UPI003B985795
MVLKINERLSDFPLNLLRLCQQCPRLSCHTLPDFQLAKHDLNPTTSFVAAHVMLDSWIARFAVNQVAPATSSSAGYQPKVTRIDAE